jgi:ATP-dependent Lon protease
MSLLWRVAEVTGTPQSLRLPNTLIVGKPGWGKTYFIHRLGEVLGLPFRALQMSSMSAGFILCGSDPVWSTARPGLVHDMLVGGGRLNPLVLLDEIDKIASDARYPADGPLYQLLEPEQARSFRDEYAAYPIDASHINWFASANELGKAHPAILSRFDIYVMPDPTPEVSRLTARSVYRESLERSPWQVLFDPAPTDDVIEILASYSPREAHQKLKKAFGKASLAGRSQLVPEDFEAARTGGRRIGFV